MDTKKKQPFEFKNPFSEEFLIAWNYWKAFKKEQFRFVYKPMGEQAAIDDLFEISKGDEQTAKLIIKQSLVKGWRGLFEIKNTGNGKPDTESRKDLVDVLSTRDYERGQTGRSQS